MIDEIFNNFEVRQSTLKVKVDSIENLCKKNFCLHEYIDEIKGCFKRNTFVKSNSIY